METYTIILNGGRFVNVIGNNFNWKDGMLTILNKDKVVAAVNTEDIKEFCN